MQISRRDALLGATAAAVVTGAITAPLAIKAAGVKAALAGEPLIALEQEWLAIHKELQERGGWWSRAHDRLPAWARGGEDQHGRNWGWPDVGDLPEFKSACKAGLSTRAPLWEVESFNEAAQLAAAKNPTKHAETMAQCDARVRAWEARQTEKTDLERQLGFDDWDAKSEPFFERQDAVEEKIMDTPAHSFAGIAVKLRLAAYYADPGKAGPESLDWDRKIMFHAFRDATRLAREVRPT